MTWAMPAAGIALAVAAAPAWAQSYRTVVESRRLDRGTPVQVDVEFAVGGFRLAPAGANQLYRVSITYVEDWFTPDIAFDPDAGRLRVDLSRQRGARVPDLKDSRQHLDLALSREVPLDLDLSFGAMEADVELGGLSLRSAQIRTGASETTLAFSEPNQVTCERLTFEVGAAEFRTRGLGNSRCRHIHLRGAVGAMVLDFTGAWAQGDEMRVDVSVGLGEVRVRVPEGVGVRLNVARFLASVSRSGLTKRGSAYYSADYDSAPAKLLVDINAALGSIEVDWVR